jgi:CCR4-NOT transcription complex subunit 6
LLPPLHEVTTRLPLVSAYAQFGEPKYTNFTGHFVGVLDYIFYTKTHLTTLGILEVDKEEVLKKDTALPSLRFSSDHIALVTELDWTD